MVRFGDDLAKLSDCKRQQQGAVIFPVDCSMVYSIGYNGPARGRSNTSCLGEDAVGFCGCAHAECNAVAKFNPHSAKESVMYCTTEPCAWCANAILNAGRIRGIIYRNTYRDPQGRNIIVDSSRISMIAVAHLESPSAEEEALLNGILDRWQEIVKGNSIAGI